MNSTILLKYGKYTYKVTYKLMPGLPKYRQVNKSKAIPMIRKPTCIFYDRHDDMFKEIVYPAELHNTDVMINDPIETYIHSIMEFLPDWQKIEIQP